MNYFEAVISGIIQGITEFLPVSSSGHLSLFWHFAGRSGQDFAVFTVILHLSTLTAVIIAFRKTIYKLLIALKNLCHDVSLKKIKLSSLTGYDKMLVMLFISLSPLLLSFLLRHIFENISGDNDIIIEGLCFLITSSLLFKSSSHRNNFKTADEMDIKDALIIGLMQALSPLPGISRSGSTISSAILLGYSKEFSMEFSFIMGIPAVLAAIFLDLPKAFSQDFPIPLNIMSAGIFTSFIVGLLSIYLLKKLMADNKFRCFAFYTLFLGTITIIAGIFGM